MSDLWHGSGACDEQGGSVGFSAHGPAKSIYCPAGAATAVWRDVYGGAATPNAASNPVDWHVRAGPGEDIRICSSLGELCPGLACELSRGKGQGRSGFDHSLFSRSPSCRTRVL